MPRHPTSYARSARAQVNVQAPPPRGAWKLAYADFATAMMAFFLLMWLVSGTNPATRSDVAAYFGAETAVPVADASDPAFRTEPPQQQVDLGQGFVMLADIDNVRVEAMADRLIVDLSHASDAPLFALASDRLTPDGLAALDRLVPELARLDHDMIIEGHSDALATHAGARSNWALSAARAERVRQRLVESGFPASRIVSVSGRANSDPLPGLDPSDPANRRIRFIFLLSKDTTAASM